MDFRARLGPLPSICACLWVSLAAWSASASQCYSNFDKDSYSSCAQLSPNVSLHWAVQSGYITFALDVDGAWDWVGVGIAEGGMLGADLAVAEHDLGAAQWTAKDYWSTSFGFPQLDKQQDVQLVSVARHASGGAASNALGSTLVALRRPLDSCDPYGQDRAVLNDTRQTVVFAYGAGPFGYHGTTNRGQSDVKLVPNVTVAAAAAAEVAAAAASMQVLEVRMPNFTVPHENATTYQCVNVELPSDAKYHIYRYEPIIDNTPLVHHFVAYICAAGTAPNTTVGVAYECMDYMECFEFYMGWAPGMGAIDAPPAAALAFGEDSVRYLSLQIHYTNMNGVQGQTDSSGFRVHYSSTLKQYDMGVLTLGSFDVAVPAGAPSWSTAPNVCPGVCTSKLAAGVGARSVTLVESFYHMHQLGRSMVTRHVRNGVELPPLGVREFFDFDYQASVDIPPGARQLLPGDVLITSCTYTGVGRSNVTKYGPASYEEMCFNFLTYYPYNPNITNCLAFSELNMASCTTDYVLETIQAADDVQRVATAGQLVPLPPDNWTYTPYRPTCKRTVGYQAAAGDDAAAARRHRNVGGAVAAILLITLVGGIAVFVVYRIMRKRRQAEEEQHLFEKYNPSTIALPIVAAGNTQDTGGGASGPSSTGYSSLTTSAV